MGLVFAKEGSYVAENALGHSLRTPFGTNTAHRLAVLSLSLQPVMKHPPDKRWCSPLAVHSLTNNTADAHTTGKEVLPRRHATFNAHTRAPKDQASACACPTRLVRTAPRHATTDCRRGLHRFSNDQDRPRIGCCSCRRPLSQARVAMLSASAFALT